MWGRAAPFGPVALFLATALPVAKFADGLVVGGREEDRLCVLGTCFFAGRGLDGGVCVGLGAEPPTLTENDLFIVCVGAACVFGFCWAFTVTVGDGDVLHAIEFFTNGELLTMLPLLLLLLLFDNDDDDDDDDDDDEVVVVTLLFLTVTVV